jgi:hypothetical protein
MDRVFTLREKHLAWAVRQRLVGDYRFEVCEDELRFSFGGNGFLLSRDNLTEAPDLGRVADAVAQALHSTCVTAHGGSLCGAHSSSLLP